MELSQAECNQSSVSIGRECWLEIKSVHDYLSKSVEKCGVDTFPSRSMVQNAPAGVFPFPKIWLHPEIYDGKMYCHIYNPTFGRVDSVNCANTVANTICVRNSDDLWAPSNIRNFRIDKNDIAYMLSWNASLE